MNTYLSSLAIFLSFFITNTNVISMEVDGPLEAGATVSLTSSCVAVSSRNIEREKIVEWYTAAVTALEAVIWSRHKRTVKQARAKRSAIATWNGYKHYSCLVDVECLSMAAKYLEILGEHRLSVEARKQLIARQNLQDNHLFYSGHYLLTRGKRRLALIAFRRLLRLEEVRKTFLEGAADRLRTIGKKKLSRLAWRRYIAHSQITGCDLDEAAEHLRGEGEMKLARLAEANLKRRFPEYSPEGIEEGLEQQEF